MSRITSALDNLDLSIKELATAWNTSEGRRGRIADNRRAVLEDQEAIEKERETLLQEQWRLRKEASTLQHARDEAQNLTQEIGLLRGDRETARQRMREVLANLKTLQKELRR